MCACVYDAVISGNKFLTMRAFVAKQHGDSKKESPVHLTPTVSGGLRDSNEETAVMKSDIHRVAKILEHQCLRFSSANVSQLINARIIIIIIILTLSTEFPKV